MASDSTSNFRTARLGLLSGLTAAAFFAVMALFARLCRLEMSFGQIVFARAAGAIWVLGLLHRKELVGIFGRETRILWTRAFFGSVAVFCYFLNIQESSIGVATTLNNLSPVFVLVLSVVLFGKRVSCVGVAGVIVATTGVGFLSMPSGAAMDFKVLVIGLASAVSAALAYISLKRASGQFSSGVVVFCFSVVLLGFSLLDPGVYRFDPARVPWLPLLGMVVSALLAQLFLTISFRSQEATTAATVNLTVVVWAWLLDIVFLGTQVSFLNLVGVAAVLVGVYLCNSGEKK